MKTWKKDHCLAQDKEDSTLYWEYSIPDLPTILNNDTMSLANSLLTKLKFLSCWWLMLASVRYHKIGCICFSDIKVHLTPFSQESKYNPVSGLPGKLWAQTWKSNLVCGICVLPFLNVKMVETATSVTLRRFWMLSSNTIQ